MYKNLIFISFSIIFFLSCSVKNNIPEVVLEEEEILDTLVVTASKQEPMSFELEKYNPEADKLYDLKHMDLDISFDWKEETVNGKAILTASPYFYPISSITLDAKQMDILKLTSDGINSLNYTYEGQDLNITLDRMYRKEETFKIYIEYVAHPTLGRVSGAFGAADQGLYFIDSDGNDPEKPSQIWSQGETEYNSAWFPTRDKPNEKFTHDIKITVDDKYATLSNGFLVSSNKLSKDTRTDHWRMDDPHAPYLTMITVGEFAVVKEMWENIPLMYYVEKEYEPYAKNIFHHTPEMLTFFSELTGVKYPWDQYAQVVIRDFVAGAMENTTAVTFGEFVQKTDEELIDNNNDEIVAHEMFHHWFGDYVTCESWANLTLNEGFANYSEYLWTEHKYGQVTADNKRLNELSGYFYQAKNQGVHPLIHYSYTDKEDMFDAHSYNKGGLILHMLRYEIGDEAFFAAIKKYLTQHAYTTVEVDELRIAFEDVTGRDLKVFFNQWYLSKGHPELEINYTVMDGKLTVSVEQVQLPSNSLAIFQIPLEFDIYFVDGSKERKKGFMNMRKQDFEYETKKEVSWVNFDPEHVLLTEYSENRDAESYTKELLTSNSQFDKREALARLRSEKIDQKIYENILVSDENYINKWISLNNIPYTSDKKALFLEALEKADNVYLRGKLISLFDEHLEDIPESVLSNILEKEKSWSVISPALFIMSKKNKSYAENYIKQNKDEKSSDFIMTVANIAFDRKDVSQFNTLLDKLPNVSERSTSNFSKIMVGLLPLMNETDLNKAFQTINDQVFTSDKIAQYKKAALGNALVEIQETLSEDQILIFVEAIKKLEIPE